ncbi:D-inositol-3-phosphate glycosyltransferase [Nonomuraea coxensis DSM 45129]|uniref:D-inositol-3-phosphate glycosyltransferase n=1 Tax=Nonomuraea coxensis DSM 45129 TaxID=1122611 RepID=A0ABX8U5D0_9ACTN|nr:glycosyltransferase family 4 protein [Nonomuraea coxensis]QYC42890.1 D-inositol-3-phosphate glycosyltransferase [Nonomuraea coxensis DSM 45129]
MRILLAQNLIHLPSHGGANKSNRLLMERLAARGHEVHVVAPLSGALATGPSSAAGLAAALGELTRRGARMITSAGPDEVAYLYHGVLVHAVTDPAALPRRVAEVAARLVPDWTLVPSDDPGLVVLGAALRATPGRVVYLVHTLQQLPFGPGAFYPSAAGTRMVRRAAGVVAVSRAARDHCRRYADLHSTVIYPHIYDDDPPATAPTAPYVTMINPCGYKGLPILLGLADACPDLTFQAVPTWGATAEERAALVRRPNIRLTPPADDLGPVLAATRVLLMPSLWDETFGYTCVEAMLRGVPVLAADVGGLAEAKRGVPYLLPVAPIERYEAAAGHARPVPVVPAQDLTPWLGALRRLMDDPAHHAALAARSADAARAFVRGLDRDALEAYLTALTPARRRPDPPPDPHRRAALARLAAARAAEKGAAR